MYLKIIIISILLSAQLIFSGTESNVKKIRPKGIDVTAIAANRPFTEHELSILGSFKSRLKKLGVFNPDSPMYEILLSFKKLNDSKTIISVTTLQPISERLVMLGKKNQVFYGDVNIKAKRASGKVNNEIREYMSEEYVKQYRMILESDIYILSDKHLENETERIIAHILEKPFLKRALTE